MKNLRNLCLSLLALFLSVTSPAWAQRFAAGKRYAIQCQYAEGYVVLGQQHGQPYTLYYITGETSVPEDAVWQAEGSDTEGYTFTNVLTQERLAWCNTYNNNTKYLTMAAPDGTDLQRWLLQEETSDGYFVIRSKYAPTYYFNLRQATMLLGCYAGGPGNEADRNFYRFVEVGGSGEGGEGGEGGGDGDDDAPTVDGDVLPHSGELIYVQGPDEALTAIPRDFCTDYVIDEDGIRVLLMTGKALFIPGAESVALQCPVELPHFASYKFNNKFNDQLFQDAVADEAALHQDTFSVSVAQIGKYLTASFTFDDYRAKAWVDGVPQKSKVTRQRMAAPVTYTLGREDWRQLQLRQDADGQYGYEYIPFGRRTTVAVDFLTDHPSGTYKLYNVPRVTIVTANRSLPMSKTTYMQATIAIDGCGVFPDMPTTDILIKGRGNSSWSGSTSSKNPYHFKFEEKQKPLGMTGGKHWVLLANKQTGSMLCNALEQKASALAGCAAPCHIVPVELYLNGQYRGSYNLTEKVGFGNNSVDLDDESCAAMLELDTYTDESIWTSNSYGVCTKIHDPDFDPADTQILITKQNVISDWNAATQALRYGGSEDYLGCFQQDYLASYLFANELCFNTELQHAKSVFLYSENVLDDGFKLTGIDETPWVLGPMWDCDWSFGYEASMQYFTASAETDYYDGKLYGKLNNFWYDMRYKSRTLDRAYYALWHDFLTDGRMDELVDYVQEYYDYAAPSLRHNSSSVCSERDGSNYATIANRAADWLRKRADYVFGSLTPYDLPVPPKPEVVRPQIVDFDDALHDVRPDMALDGQLYDLAGRPIPAAARPRAGVYIQGGRKVLLR